MQKLVDGVLVDLTPEEEATAEADAAAPPSVPPIIEMRKAKLEMLATPWPLANPTTTLLAVVKAVVAAGGEALQIEFDGNTLSRRRDLVLGLQAQLGVPDALMDALFIAANGRP